MRTLVLGLGNTLLGDDGVAVRLVEALAETLRTHGIDTKTSSISGLALVDEILGYDTLFVVDAVKTGSRDVGETFEIQPQSLDTLPSGMSPHYVGLPSLIKYCHSYGLHAPEQFKILGIEVDDPFSFREKLGFKLENKFPEIIKTVKSWILSNN